MPSSSTQSLTKSYAPSLLLLEDASPSSSSASSSSQSILSIPSLLTQSRCAPALTTFTSSSLSTSSTTLSFLSKANDCDVRINIVEPNAGASGYSGLPESEAVVAVSESRSKMYGRTTS